MSTQIEQNDQTQRKTCLLCCESPLLETNSEEFRIKFKLKFVDIDFSSIRNDNYFYCKFCGWIYQDITTSNYQKYLNKIEITDNVKQLIQSDIQEFKESIDREKLFREVVGIVRRHEGTIKELYKSAMYNISSIEDVRYFSLNFEVGKRYLEVKKSKKPNGQQIYRTVSWGIAY